jgi:uncharacterized cupin superfamily protein
MKMAKRIDPASQPVIVGTVYPDPYDRPCRPRRRIKLGDVAGLTQFGINQLTLPPGAWSSQRHYHTKSDEFVYVLSGQVTLVTGDGEEVFEAGDCAGFPAGEQSGHCFQNRSDAPAVLLEMGTRVSDDAAYYPGLDLVAPAGGKPAAYTRVDGTPYANLVRRGPEED